MAEKIRFEDYLTTKIAAYQATGDAAARANMAKDIGYLLEHAEGNKAPMKLEAEAKGEAHNSKEHLDRMLEDYRSGRVTDRSHKPIPPKEYDEALLTGASARDSAKSLIDKTLKGEELKAPAPTVAAPAAKPKQEAPEKSTEDKEKPVDTKAFEEKELQYGSGFKHGTKDGKGKADIEEREAARQTQLALQKLGYDVGKGGADGRLGSDTMDAINKFEKENGIEPPSEKDGTKPIKKETLKKLAEKVKEKEKEKETVDKGTGEDKGEKKPEDKKPGEIKPEEKKAEADMITVKPKKDMTVDEMAAKLGVDKDKKNDFKNAMDDALGGRTKLKGGEEVHVDAKKYGISPGDKHSASAKGVDVKPSTGRA